MNNHNCCLVNRLKVTGQTVKGANHTSPLMLTEDVGSNPTCSLENGLSTSEVRGLSKPDAVQVRCKQRVQFPAGDIVSDYEMLSDDEFLDKYGYLEELAA